MLEVKHGWRSALLQTLTRLGLLDNEFSGKLVITVADGTVKAAEVTQTVK